MKTLRPDFVELERSKKSFARRRARPTRFSFPGIEPSRKLPGWGGMNLSADATILPDLAELRARSRQLVLSSPIAVSMLGRTVDNVVGTGIRMQSRPDVDALRLKPEQTRDFTRRAERAWARWSPFADIGGRMNDAQMQALVMRQFLQDGEFFLARHMSRDPRRPYRFCWDVIDPDRIESPNGTDSIADPIIRSGVELDPVTSEAVAYHVRIGHPGDLQYSTATFSWQRIPAFDPDGRPNVIHGYQLIRPGATRGVPVLAPLLSLFHDLEELNKAKLWRERMAACYAAMITTMDPGLAAEAQAEANLREGLSGREERVEELYPGMVTYLEPGQQVTFGTPTGLSQPTEEFVRGIVQALGAALGIPYFLTMLDFKSVNYSSARAGLLEFWRRVRALQRFVIFDRFLMPSWRLLLEEAYLRGELGLILFEEDPESWVRARHVPEGKGMIEPVKEIQSSELAMKTRVSTLADECAIHGRDWEEVLEQIRREQDLAAELDVTLPSAQSAPAPVPVPAGGPAGEDDDDEENDDDEDED